MKSTMQDGPLLIRNILKFGQWIHSEKKIFTVTEDGVLEGTFSDVARNAEKLAHALARLGIEQGDRVGTFMWNNQWHMEAYMAVPSMGAVLHTLNIRLFPEQLAYIINHADDKILLVDGSLLPSLAKVKDSLAGVRHIIVKGDGDRTVLGRQTLDYDELLASEGDGYDWPDLDERSAAAMCYTSGTTGNPKGVVYSHRSTWLHSIASTSANSVGFSDRDRALLIVPMFHVNAWGATYTSFMSGTELVLPQQHLQGGPIVEMIRTLRPTLALGVPTVWNDVLRVAESDPTADFSSLRTVMSGGSAVPRQMITAFRDRHGIDMVQGWGMTETSPLAAVSIPPAGTPIEKQLDYRVKAGRLIFGVDVRIVDDHGATLPNDGASLGEFEISGPWITGSYFGDDDASKFHDGWLRTGDIGTLDGEGFMVISDRSKDVIKSGGEWISSVELENTVMAHPDVFEAAVVAVPDERWDERPLCCVVLNPEAKTTVEELVEWLTPRVAKWWIPERWSFVETVPKTSVGKFDKKVLRSHYADGSLNVIDRTATT